MPARNRRPLLAGPLDTKEFPASPRCRKPMRDYNLNRPPEFELDAICWRPAGHPGKHRSWRAYLHARQQRVNRKIKQP